MRAMNLNPTSNNFWAQDRLSVALAITICIMLVAAIIYVIYLYHDKLESLINKVPAAKTIKVFRFLLGGSAILAFILSLMPRHDLGMGVLFYFFLWPLLGVQLGVVWLPWEKFAQNRSGAAIVISTVVGFHALVLDLIMVGIAGYYLG